jgi:nitroreductase
MYLYEAISCRHTVRRYLEKKVPEELRRQILRFFDSTERLDENLAAEAVISDREKRGSRRKQGLRGREAEAPQLLTVYSEAGALAEKNAGYILEQVSLYLVCKGIGSRIISGEDKAGRVRNGKKAMISMEFGYPDEPLFRESPLAKRLPLRKLCFPSEEPEEAMRTILRAARLAPSALNCQPWRFETAGMKLRVFEKITLAGKLAGRKYREISFGCMLANISLAADELWLHENISFANPSSGKGGNKLNLMMTITFTP